MSRLESFSGRLSSCKTDSCHGGKVFCDCGTLQLPLESRAALLAGRALQFNAGMCLNSGSVVINYVLTLPQTQR